MPSDIEAYLRLPYAVEVVPDTTSDGGLCYVAMHPELSGCMAHGDTVDEAVENLEDARELYISTLIKRGLPVPLPEAMTATHVLRREVIWRREDPVRPTAERQTQQYSSAA